MCIRIEIECFSLAGLSSLTVSRFLAGLGRYSQSCLQWLSKVTVTGVTICICGWKMTHLHHLSLARQSFHFEKLTKLHQKQPYFSPQTCRKHSIKKLPVFQIQLKRKRFYSKSIQWGLSETTWKILQYLTQQC